MGTLRTSGRSRRISGHVRRALSIGLGGVVLATAAIGLADPAAAAKPKLNTAVTLSTAQPLTGAPVTVSISYSCSSATTNCAAAQLVMNLPAALADPTSVATTPHVTSWAYSAASRNIRFWMIDPLPAGSTGQVSFSTAFTQGTTPDNLSVSLQSTMTATNATTVNSTPVTMTANVVNNWHIQKSVTTAGSVDGNSVYAVTVCRPAGNYGSINMLDGTMVDTLPAGSVFVSATGSYSYDSTTNKVTWTFGALPYNISGACLPVRNLTVLYPSPTFAANQNVTNKSTGTGHVPGVSAPLSVPLGQSNVTHTLTPASGTFSISKSSGQGTIVNGQFMPYTITVTNTGSLPIAPYWYDYLPVGMRIRKGDPIGIGDTKGANVDIYYSTDQNPRSPASAWYLVPGGPFKSASQTSFVAAPALAGGAKYATGLKYMFQDPIPAGAASVTKLNIFYSGLDDNDVAIPNNTVIQNCVTVKWVFNGNKATNACANTKSSVPNPQAAVSNSPQTTYLVPGQVFNWLSTVQNNGNVPEDWTVTNIFPDGLSIPPSGKIGLGNTSGATVDIWYSTATGPRTTPVWTKVAGGPFTSASNSSFVNAPASLPGSGKITGLKYVFNSSMAIGAFWQAYQYPVFSATDDTGATIPAGTILTNCVSVVSTYPGGYTFNGQGCGTKTVTPLIEINANKNNGAASYTVANFGTRVDFPLVYATTSNSWYPITDPVLVDVVPPQALPWGASWAASYAVNSMPGLTFTPATDFSATPSGQNTILKWQFHGNLVPNSTLKVTASIKAAFDLPYVNYVDDMWTGGTMNPQAVPPICQVNAGAGMLGTQTDTNNYLGFGSAYKGCHSQWGFQVAPYAALDSLASVHGQLDGGYVQYPTAGQSVPGGLADYRLQFTNSGNVDMKNAVVVDVLPWVGDTEVLQNVARGSGYAPNLAGPVVPSDPNITVWYSKQTDPCEPAIGISSGCVNAAWTTTPYADITQVRSVKFTFGSLILHPGQTFQLDWPMRVPNGTPPGSVAWDSFAYTATRSDTNATLLPSEPHAIGINVNAGSLNSIGDRVWSDANDDGLQQAGETGVNGVIVRLYDAGTNALVAQTVSGNNFAGKPGYFLFPNLPDGTYYQVFDLTTMPKLGQVSPYEVGYPANAAIDSDADQTTGRTPNIVVSGNQNASNWDMGVFICNSDVSCG
jgi:hypothetical protein